MAQLIILGTSNAIPSRGHENTHMVVLTPERTVLIDCASNEIVRLEQAGVALEQVSEIILTHFHPDHVGGLPLFLLNMWLMGRQSPLNIYGLGYTLDRVKSMMDLYGWNEWPNFFTVNFFVIPTDDMALVLNNEQMRIIASPVKHFLPNIGLRIELKAENKNIAYSCDTEPCQSIVDLAQGVDILLHETTGDVPGHSSAVQAATVARNAGAGALYLIHYPTGRFASGDLVAEARTVFPGKIVKALDLMEIELTEKRSP